MLCEVCVGVIQHRRGLQFACTYLNGKLEYHFENLRDDLENLRLFQYSHHLAFSTLADSVSRGCRICRSFWDDLSESERDGMRNLETAAENENLTAMRIEHANDCSYEITIHVKELLIFWVAYSLEPVRGDVNNNPPCAAQAWSQNTKDALPTAGQWLHDCRRDHKACNREVDTDTSGPWYPTRLIYLGDTECDVRLIKTAETAPSGPYMTLSHRWGTALFTQLLKSNLDSFCNSIPVANLREIFQEAIFASRQLGVRYLWIDSLCIMQDKDDLADWKHEASLMSKVYSNSHCNLSASDTDKDAKTLFNDRKVQDVQSIHVRLCTTGFGKCADFVICRLIYYRLWDVNVSGCPIQERGWVYQERSLAPRIIHFGHNQLFYECREQQFCEQYPYGLPQAISRHASVNFKRFMDFERINLELAHHDLYPGSRNRNDACFRIWANVVKEYSQTALTRPTDKLIAISGIAKSFADITGQKYVAGMWHESLEYALMWKNSNFARYKVDDPLFSSPTTWCAPSWSWASVDAPTDFLRSDRTHLLISVQDVVLIHATDDKMGLLTGGWLDLRGALKLMRISRHGDISSTANIWTIKDLGTGMPDEALLKTRASMHLDYRYLNPLAFGGETKVNLFYIPVAFSNGPRHFVAHLLILRVIDRPKLLFERVGVMWVWAPDQKVLDELLKNDTGEKKKECLPNLEYLDDNTHIIRIY